jgi:hypothetical protein
VAVEGGRVELIGPRVGEAEGVVRGVGTAEAVGVEAETATNAEPAAAEGVVGAGVEVGPGEAVVGLYCRMQIL